MSTKKILILVCALIATNLFSFEFSKIYAEQVIYRANGGEPQDLDPNVIVGVPEWNIIRNLFEGLVNLDQKTLKPIPGVAKSWKLSKDSLTYTFNFNENALWSNKKKITAEDFVYSYERILNPKLAAEYAYQLYFIKNAKAYNTGKIKDFKLVGAKAKDSKTLEITLENPTPFFLQVLTHHSLFPVNKESIEKYGSKWTRPGNIVTNGAYLLKEWKPQDVVIIEKNPHYWDKDKVKIQKAYFYSSENIDTEEKMFASGKVQWTETVPSIKIPVWQKTNSLRIDPYLGIYYYRINVTKPVLNNKLVRQALSLAVDREKIIKYILKGARLPTTGFTPKGMPSGYEPPNMVEYNLEKAKKLLKEAGYPNGKGFPKFEILFNTQEDHKRIALAIQQMWKRNLGIDVGVYNQEWKVYLASQTNLQYDFSRSGWIGDYVDPDAFLGLMVTNGGNNNTGWSNKEYDKLIELAAKEQDIKKRNEHFYNAEKILLDEMPVIPIYIYTNTFLLSPKVKGFQANILDYHLLKDLYIDEKQESTAENNKKNNKS